MNPGKFKLANSDRFLVRSMAVSDSEDIQLQVEQLVESISPFPLRQLYFGALLADDRRSALVYLGFRKHFQEEEIATWRDADGVYPGFLPLCVAAPGRESIVLHCDERRATAVAWA